MIQARGRKRLAGFAALVAVGLFWPSTIAAFSSKELLILLGFGGDDHEKLTVAAVANIGSGYPDIQRIRVRIIDESSNEGIAGLGAHDRVSGADPQIWADNQDDWQVDGRRLYNEMQYAEAYGRFAWAVHLVQDIKVPAHQKNVFHGKGGTYVRSPDDTTPISGVSHFDLFEVFTSNNHDHDTPPDVQFDRAIVDPKTGCTSYFWLNDDDDGDASTGEGNGAYGRNNSGCSAPTTGAGEDWFADLFYPSALEPLGRRIAHAQLYEARLAAENLLKNISESLPPLSSNLAIGGAGGGALPIINNQSGSLLSG